MDPELRPPPGPPGASARPRILYLDALRGVALARVVLFHALGQDWVLLFSALPLMFFVAGWLFAASLERKDAGAVVRSRFRRILPPYWVYVAAMFVLWAALGVLGELDLYQWISFVMPVVSPGGPRGPGSGTDLALTWTALWYLQMHLILALVGPVLRRLQLRRPFLMWSGIAALTLLALAVGSFGGMLICLYTGSWILGYHHHDGRLQEVIERWWSAVVVGCVVVAFIAVAVHSVVVDRSSATASGGSARLVALGLSLVGIFWLTLAVRFQRSIEPLLQGRRTRATVGWAGQRSLTIYLWHMPAIYAALAIPLPGASNWAGRVTWCVLGTLVAVLAVGWVEDVAARRPLSLWPTGTYTDPEDLPRRAGHGGLRMGRRTSRYGARA